MRTTHWVTVAMLLGSLSLLVASLHNWQEAASPQFISGFLGMLATTFKAMGDDKVQRKDS